MITLTRHSTSEKGTTGTLEVEDLRLPTIEPPWRDNTPSVSCIPSGVYTLSPYTSGRYGDCFRLLGGTVGSQQGYSPRFAVLIHAGNWHTDSQGCILPGLSKGWDDTKDLPAVWHSRKAMARLRNAIDGPVELVIGWG